MKGNGIMPGKYQYIMSDFDANIAIKAMLNDQLSEYR